MISSVMPSLKYSFSGSALMLASGRTAMALARGVRARPARRARSPVPRTASPFTWRSASTNCAAVENRSTGVLARARVSASSTASGTSRVTRTLGMGDTNRLAMTACADGAGEGRLAGQHLEQHAAPGCRDRCGRPRRRPRMPARGSCRSACRRPCPVWVSEPSRAQCLADAEVGHHRRALVEQDVLGLDVAVDHLVAVGVVERGGDLAGDGQGIGQRKLPLPLEPLPERAALHVGHDVEEQVAGAGRNRRPGGCAGG